MSLPLLDVKDLQAGYGRLKIVSNVSVKVDERELVAVVGPNGSGKSTLLKAIFGLCEIFSGSVFFKGIDVTKFPPYKKARMGLSYLPQVGNTFENLTVRENIILSLYDKSLNLDENLEKIYTVIPEIKGMLNRKVKTLSGGERQMVALAMCLLRNPYLILFDEPTAALAPHVAVKVMKKIASLRDELGLSIVLVEQNTRAALEVCDKALLLVSGSVRFFGDPQSLLEEKDLVKTYLGIGGVFNARCFDQRDCIQ